MYQIPVTYVDYDGKERTEDFFFHLTDAELVEMELSTDNAVGLEAMTKALIEARDGKRIVEIIKSLLLKAYGQKSIDGRRFIKSDKLREEFEQTEAYSQLFMKLAFDAKAAAEFCSKVVSKDTYDRAVKRAKEQGIDLGIESK